MLGSSVRVDFEIRLLAPESSPVGAILARWPTLRQEAWTVSSESPSFLAAWNRVSGPEEGVDALVAARRASVRLPWTFTLLYRAPREAVHFSTGPAHDKERVPDWEDRVDAVAFRTLGQARYLIERVVSEGVVIRWSVVTDHTETLPRFLRTVAANCAKRQRAFRLLSIAPYSPQSEDWGILTSRQEVALVAAWDAGYFEGRAGVRAVAARLGLSASGAHSLIARAEREVVRAFVTRTGARSTPRTGPTPGRESLPKAPAAKPRGPRSMPERGTLVDGRRLRRRR